MGAKAYLCLLAALAASGCAGALKRFAPPGIVKYEDLAKDQPVNPAIAARVKERSAAGGGGFPPLAKQPTEVPAGIAKPERDGMEETLLAERDALNKAVAEDRSVAAAERDDTPEAARDALGDAIDKDNATARRDRGLPTSDAPSTPQ